MEIAEVLGDVSDAHNDPLDRDTLGEQAEAALYQSDAEGRRDSTFWGSNVGAREMWLSMFRHILIASGSGKATLVAHEAYEHFGRPSTWQAFPDAHETLDWVRGRGLRLGIVSNWDTRLAEICSHVGLSRYLHFLVASATVGRAKPYPHIFEVALERAGVPADECVHVGDQYYADILGAQTVGMTGVLVHRDGHAPPAGCLVIRGLSELPDVVDNL